MTETLLLAYDNEEMSGNHSLRTSAGNLWRWYLLSPMYSSSVYSTDALIMLNDESIRVPTAPIETFDAGRFR